MDSALSWHRRSPGRPSQLDIAMKCGYESEAAFRKAFKRIVGVPPGKVRG
jgi:AraC-like DNA-binding protein